MKNHKKQTNDLVPCKNCGETPVLHYIAKQNNPRIKGFNEKLPYICETDLIWYECERCHEKTDPRPDRESANQEWNRIALI